MNVRLLSVDDPAGMGKGEIYGPTCKKQAFQCPGRVASGIFWKVACWGRDSLMLNPLVPRWGHWFSFPGTLLEDSGQREVVERSATTGFLTDVLCDLRQVTLLL